MGLPTVTNVTSTTSDGTLKVGDVAITVTLGGTLVAPQLTLRRDLQMRS